MAATLLKKKYCIRHACVGKSTPGILTFGEKDNISSRRKLHEGSSLHESLTRRSLNRKNQKSLQDGAIWCRGKDQVPGVSNC